MLEVKPIRQRGPTGSPKVAEAVLKPLPLQKHSLGGCTIDMTPSARYMVSPRDILFIAVFRKLMR